MSGWGDICGDEALERWKKGDSASEIAKWASKQTGLTVSRNAIIGYVHRKIGKTARAPAATPAYGGRLRLRAPEVKNSRRSDTATARNLARSLRSDGTPKSEQAPKPLPTSRIPEAPAPLMVRPLDLETTHCRWPIGDPQADDFGFCGHPNHAREEGGSWYCPAHKRASVNPKTKRQDEKSLARMIINSDRRRAA
jgi:GcrA cell cycle regulator